MFWWRFEVANSLGEGRSGALWWHHREFIFRRRAFGNVETAKLASAHPCLWCLWLAADTRRLSVYNDDEARNTRRLKKQQRKRHVKGDHRPSRMQNSRTVTQPLLRHEELTWNFIWTEIYLESVFLRLLRPRFEVRRQQVNPFTARDNSAAWGRLEAPPLASITTNKTHAVKHETKQSRCSTSHADTRKRKK